MNTLHIDFRDSEREARRVLLNREWLATNGLGGYASGTLSGRVTWRYHGLLVAALPAPFGRTVMLNHMSEVLVFPDGTEVPLQPDEENGEPSGPLHLREFRLENGLPVWRYEVSGVTIEKHILFLHAQNTIHLHYRILSADCPRITVRLRPSVNFRRHEQSVDQTLAESYAITATGQRYEITGGHDLTGLKLVLKGERSSFTYDGGSRREIRYQKDSDRGYPGLGTLWSPGYFTVEIAAKGAATLIASTEGWQEMLALNPEEALQYYHSRHERLISSAVPEVREKPGSDLVLAADQFIITPAGRIQDAARAFAAGDQVRTVIAGYHWFTDWGRDTMISLEGLTLTTGRHVEAGWILRTFAHYIRDGLIPNMFPEGESEGLYHTADATLWFFHALDRYVEVTGDRNTLRGIIPRLVEIADHHLAGTRFGIGVDPRDGLLRQGAEGYQLTWMDAKVEDWVVTPRRGKPVEINALWHNALRLLESWLRKEGQSAQAETYAKHAARCEAAFNQRFWYEQGGYLYDVIDGEQGDDASCRPNQILSFSLKHPVLDPAKWSSVLENVETNLLTPVGLRSLSSKSSDYKSKYFGDLRARDAAYHQGTVWAWLIGPFVDAWLRVHSGDKAGARRFLQGLCNHLKEECVGSVNEVFDAEAPFTPRGCIAQAWSVAELLRALAKTTPANGEPAKQS